MDMTQKLMRAGFGVLAAGCAAGALLLAAPSLATPGHTPCGRTKARHTNCGKHKGVSHHAQGHATVADEGSTGDVGPTGDTGPIGPFNGHVPCGRTKERGSNCSSHGEERGETGDTGETGETGDTGNRGPFNGHVPCGRTKARHTNCGKHLGQHKQKKHHG